MAKEWPESLQQEKVEEFSFYPHAYTPFEKESALELPDVDMDWDGGDDKKDSDSKNNSQTPSWVQNLSFSIGGLTIGAAAVYGILGGGAPSPACPAPAVTAQTVQTPAPTSPATPIKAAPVRGTTAPAATSTASSTNATTSPAAGSVFP